MELDLEEGGRVNIVRAGRLQRSKDKQQSGKEEEGKRGKCAYSKIFASHCQQFFENWTLLDTKKEENNILGRGRLI